MYGGTVKWFDKGKGFGLVGDGHGGYDAPAGFSSIMTNGFNFPAGKKLRSIPRLIPKTADQDCERLPGINAAGAHPQKTRKAAGLFLFPPL